MARPKYQVGYHISMYAGTKKEIIFGTVSRVRQSHWTPTFEYYIRGDNPEYDKFWIDEKYIIAWSGKINARTK